MNRRLYSILFLLLLLHAQLSAAPADSVSALQEHTWLWQMVDAPQRQNPALHGTLFSSSFSQLCVEADWQHQSESFLLQEGTGHLLPSASVDSYLRLSNRTAVWGHASYMNGKQYDITWNSTTDYRLLQPYVLADTLGGDTRRERYRFEGGYATRLGHWLLGAEMLFRADHEYRDVDPRMRGVVNELTLRLGAGYDAWNYRWAAAFEGNIYKQRNSVDFYRELGVIPEYQMTGLGTEYSRFSGDKRSLQYEGGGTRLLFDATPLHSRGLYAHIALSQHRYHRLLTENYTLPLTDLYTQSVRASIGWRRMSVSRLAVFADVEYQKRSGDEHIIGTSATTSFPDLGVLTMYKNRLFDSRLTALYGMPGWHVSASVGYQSNNQEYAYPQRLLEVAHVYGRLVGETFLKPSERFTLTARLEASYKGRVSDKFSVPFVDLQPSFAQMLSHTYTFAKANYTELAAMVRADYRLRGYGLFAALAGGWTGCSASANQTAARLSLGVTF